MTGNASEALAAVPRVRPRVWIGIAAVVVYVLFAAGLGNLLGDLAADDDVVREFALSHLIPLPIVIALTLLFVRWAGWWRPVWKETPTPRLTPRRWWLVAIPVLALLLPMGQIVTIPWSDRAVAFLLVVAIGTLLVGLGEELVFRGVLLVSIRENHGEAVTMLGTALLFALAHVFSSLWLGLDPAFIVIQVAALAMTGVTYYWVRRVTGRLWVGVLLHAFTDFVLYVASGAGNQADALDNTSAGNPVSVTAQILLAIATAVSVISVIREDLRTRRRRTASAD